jgi:hypothetical protein
MATNRAAIRVGRLLEVLIDGGYRTVSDVDVVFDAIDAEVARLAPSQRIVTVADWRRCPVMSPEAAQRVVQRIVLLNPRTERSTALVSPDAPVAVLQFLRVIRESRLPDRKLFLDPEELADWLQEILTPAETVRLREFLAAR